jgi:predicted O-methyltransferase YrrM
MKSAIKKAIPPTLLNHITKLKWDFIARFRKRMRKIGAVFASAFQRMMRRIGYTVARKSDYYSPLPALDLLEKTYARWNRPSALTGITYDLEAMKTELRGLLARYADEFAAFPPFAQLRKVYGPGYTPLDALTLYMMMRRLQPKRYIEVGSGLSTYYSSLAAAKNADAGHPLQMTCIEPHPYEKLYSLPGVQVIPKEVQDVELSLFQQLEAGDVLFIDSTHVLNIDGDVPYLYLEVLPSLEPGVTIHIHDVPFPYNIPYPPELWVFGQTWPVFWNEAMLLQAFLAFNKQFEIVMSLPLIRHFDEPFLKQVIPNYETVEQNPNTFSSIWLKRMA